MADTSMNLASFGLCSLPAMAAVNAMQQRAIKRADPVSFCYDLLTYSLLGK